MAVSLSDKQIKDFKQTFALFDQNGDGFITSKELGSLMKLLGESPTEAELQDVINEVDMDGSGTVNLDEFINLMERRTRDSDADDELLEAFRVFDKDNNGLISEKEFKEALSCMGETMSDKEVKKLLKDGHMTFADFRRHMTN